MHTPTTTATPRFPASTLSIVLLSVAMTCLGAGAASAAGPQIGSWGYDLAGKDLSVRPGDDFFRFSGGRWLQTQQLPADKTRYGTFDILADRAEADARRIIEELAAAPAAPGTASRKVGDFYNAYLDTAAIDRRGLAPLASGLKLIRAARTHGDIARLMARPDLPLNGPIGAGVSIDQKNPDRYIVVVSHAGLGLPEREYYLRDDEQFRQIRSQYRAHMARLLELGGLARGKSALASADRIIALETEIAKRHWPIAQRRERDQTYNLKSRAELVALLAGYPVDASLDAAGLGDVREFIVRELSAMQPLAQLFQQTPVKVWREYLGYHYLRGTAQVLPQPIDAEVFDFFGRVLNGQPEQRPRWKRAVDAVNGTLGEAVGQVYVQRHFPPDSKRQMLELVENVRKAYAQRIRALPWMTDETKQVALEKLAAFRPKIGYPDKWRDYSKLEVRADDAFGNLQRAAVFEWQHDLERLGGPTDRDEWFMTPQTVNAYYNPVFNEIVFPAAILQPPFFDPAADPAVNYGGIGGVIGHEMGHGFDDQGAKSDARGVLRTWWNARDEQAFKALGDRLVEQYSQFEPLPGLRLNGRLSLGENIGDLGGLSVALEAYRLSLGGQPAAVIDGLTGEQRFFHGWAQVWRTLFRDQRLRNQIMTGPHSPAEFRVNGVVRNIDAWYEAFDVKPGDRLYLPPEQRVRIW
jgi:putative endopeptidase